MKNLVNQILEYPKGDAALFFLGQAGFVIKSIDGLLVGIDLYLSNCCERIYGYKRLMPYLLQPSDIVFDYIIATHAHEDHFDVDSIAKLLSNRTTKFIAAVDCQKGCEDLGLNPQQISFIRLNDEFWLGEIHVRAVFCDHGAQTPYAIGLVLTHNNNKIYIAGDTALRLDKVPEILQHGPFDVMICPINGRFGNMSEKDAVTLCAEIKPGLIIPCHYWNFAEHGGDPGLFAELMRSNLPNQPFRLMTMGEMIDL